MNDKSPDVEAATDMATVMGRNIQALHERQQAEDKNRPSQVRVADAITRFAGSMAFVYIHLALFGGWIVANLPGVPLPKFDPSFVVLAMFASVEAIFLSTFVLISQNRMMTRADRRADLNLQISLLAEHETSRLITLVKALANHQGISVAHAEELPELEQDVTPEKVLDVLDTHRDDLV